MFKRGFRVSSFQPESMFEPARWVRAWASIRERGVHGSLKSFRKRLHNRFYPPPPPSPPIVTGHASADTIMRLLHGSSPYEGFDASPFPYDLQGWGSDDPVFGSLLAEVRPDLIVEIGSWKGASAIHMAKVCRKLRLDSKIICIDTWLGASEHVLGYRPEWRESLRRRHGYPQLYYTFLANVVRAKMTDRIIPLPNTSDNAAVILHEIGVAPSLVYIDGAHEEEVVYRDLRNYWELLAPNGVILGDDFDKAGVRRAATRFAENIGAPIDVRDGKFILRRGSVKDAQPKLSTLVSLMATQMACGATELSAGFTNLALLQIS